jgi:hypothetical protein
MISIHEGEISLSDFLRIVGQDEIVARRAGFDSDLNQSVGRLARGAALAPS